MSAESKQLSRRWLELWEEQLCCEDDARYYQLSEILDEINAVQDRLLETELAEPGFNQQRHLSSLISPECEALQGSFLRVRN